MCLCEILVAMHTVYIYNYNFQHRRSIVFSFSLLSYSFTVISLIEEDEAEEKTAFVFIYPTYHGNNNALLFITNNCTLSS